MKDTRGTLEADRPNEPDPHAETFVTMSKSLQHNLQETTRRQERDAVNRRTHSRSRLVQSLIEGPSIFLVVELLVYGLSLWSLFVVLAVGTGIGFVWHRLSPSPSLAGLIALGGFFVVRVACGKGPVFWAMCAMALIVCLSFAVSITRGSERMGA